jgi:hypothetical protein
MSNGPLRRRAIGSDRLELIAGSEEFRHRREPPLRLGDVVQLNSGGPNCLVVGHDLGNIVTISWRDSSGKPQEYTLPVACVHRIELAD